MCYFWALSNNKCVLLIDDMTVKEYSKELLAKLVAEGGYDVAEADAMEEGLDSGMRLRKR